MPCKITQYKIRIRKDLKDTHNIQHLANRYPFSEDLSMHNIAAVVTADGNLNVHSAKAFGNAIMTSMFGKNVLNHAFRKKKTLVANNAV